MQKIYMTLFVVIAITNTSTFAQNRADSIPASVNPELEQIFSSKTPKEYTIAGIYVSGTQSFDQNLIISISGLAIGDIVSIPGTDAFSKAISNLWKDVWF